MKIGVLTFHRCINYGSYWQARCLAENLQSLGHEAVILDHDAPSVNLAEWKCALQPTLPTPVPAADQPLYREKIQRFFDAFKSLPLSKRFPLEHPQTMDQYDVVVVGSDEVWNLSHPWYGNASIFYGDGIPARRLVAYAASFGNYPAENGLDTYWAEKLRNFDWIAVRDKNAQTIINQTLGRDPALVLDPCFQYPVEPEERYDTHLQKSYIAVYGHNFSEAFIYNIKNYANKKDVKLISIGYRNDWADEQWLTADPHDFAHFMAQAAAVATNFFHGCVFALCNNKPFVCETSSYRSIKIKDLMEQVGGEAHVVTPETPASVYRTRLETPLHSNILQKISHLQQLSNSYLERALQSEHLQYV